jgi:hypothetical protein
MPVSDQWVQHIVWMTAIGSDYGRRAASLLPDLDATLAELGRGPRGSREPPVRAVYGAIPLSIHA